MKLPTADTYLSPGMDVGKGRGQALSPPFWEEVNAVKLPKK
jgi:hypothetical protein